MTFVQLKSKIKINQLVIKSMLKWYYEYLKWI